MPWFIPAIISQEVFQRDVEGTAEPLVKTGPTPLATERDQITGFDDVSGRCFEVEGGVRWGMYSCISFLTRSRLR